MGYRDVWAERKRRTSYYTFSHRNRFDRMTDNEVNEAHVAASNALFKALEDLR